MAANRAQTMLQATKTVWSRGGVIGFYQGLIPWVIEPFVRFFDVLIYFNQAWIEASTKGAVLIFAASEIEERSVKTGLSPAVAGLLGGMGGGVAQAYATMGELSDSK